MRSKRERGRSIFLVVHLLLRRVCRMRGQTRFFLFSLFMSSLSPYFTPLFLPRFAFLSCPGRREHLHVRYFCCCCCCCGLSPCIRVYVIKSVKMRSTIDAAPSQVPAEGAQTDRFKSCISRMASRRRMKEALFPSWLVLKLVTMCNISHAARIRTLPARGLITAF